MRVLQSFEVLVTNKFVLIARDRQKSTFSGVLGRGRIVMLDATNGVATKYLDHYLSWFQFLDIVKHRNDNISITKMMVESCLFPINETYRSLSTYNY